LEYSRRQLIGAAATAALFATTAKATTLAEVVAGLEDPPAPLPDHLGPGRLPYVMPAPTPVAAEPVIDPRLLARARAAYDRFRPMVSRPGTVVIADFAKASRDPRFYLLDTASGRTTQHLVAHGRGSDPAHSGYVEHFSNRIGSEATSAGAYLTGDYYQGKYGRSMRVNGLEDRNSNANTRAIVIHSAWYAEPHVAAESGKLGRSEGCFAVSHASLQEVLARLGPGHFLYADKVA
jgi:hypothetical protein